MTLPRAPATRPPDHKGVDEAFFRELEEASHSQALLPRGLEPPRDRLEGQHSRRQAVQEVSENLLRQSAKELVRGDARLDPVPTNKEQLVRKRKVGRSFG